MSESVGEQSEDATTVNAVTAVVRDADQAFERVGGGSRHWVRDCFLPLLNAAGWQVSRPVIVEGQEQLAKAITERLIEARNRDIGFWWPESAEPVILAALRAVADR